MFMLTISVSQLARCRTKAPALYVGQRWQDFQQFDSTSASGSQRCLGVISSNI